MIIRQPQNHDIYQLAQLFDHYRQFYQQSSDVIAARDFLEDRLEHGESVILVASSNEEPTIIAGFVQLYPSFSSVSLQRSWILNDLFVEEEYRSLGFGEALVSAAIEFSKSTGAGFLALQTSVSNLQVQKLYRKLGWKLDDKYLTFHYHH